MHPDVNEYLQQATGPKALFLEWRELLLGFGLNENFKWRTPCYQCGNSNLFLLADSPEGPMLSFLTGALLDDPNSLLEAPGQYSRAVRMIRSNVLNDPSQDRRAIKALIKQAVELDQSGVKVDYEKDRELPYPDELTDRMDSDPEFAEAFASLTPGRQRGYIMHFTQAKQSKTREARIEKFRDRILQGKGMLDCVCGLSKRMPNCDGSHRQLKTGA